MPSLEKVLNEDAEPNEIFLTDEMKEAIDQGINSLNKGKGMAHHEVISHLKQKYPNFKF
jgi:predicted transcriptional regulator